MSNMGCSPSKWRWPLYRFVAILALYQSRLFGKRHLFTGDS